MTQNLPVQGSRGKRASGAEGQRGKNYQPSTVNYQPSTVNYQPSTTNYHFSFVCFDSPNW
ncbi:hypothetical protein [Scytonema millei]|uniref:Uncharacterized protein n=1 Tax=Scytonema millei VB511283 TaxID=1245923 RepID=A0A9X5E3E1_9CYAN|nr:hypothetical protein [Scytonema millei]NHC34525.1 hypothetical protein [Scytonema millei VB511283]